MGYLGDGGYGNINNIGSVVDVYHYLLEALAFAYSDRMALGDPQFVSIQNVIDAMMDKGHAASLRQRIWANQTFDPPHYIDLNTLAHMPEDHGTTHLSVMDGQGNVVALTTTVNGVWGAGIGSPSLGLVYNNEMDDFSTPNQSNIWDLPPSVNNFPGPRKKPLSSMSPTIVLRDGNPYISIGGSGGARIITAVLQVLLDTFAGVSMDLYTAIAAPRLHYQLIPTDVYAEANFNPDVTAGLAARKHLITKASFGANAVVQAIVKFPNGTFAGASDPRKYGKAAAY